MQDHPAFFMFVFPCPMPCWCVPQLLHMDHYYCTVIIMADAIQEDDGIPAAAEFSEPFLPDESPAGPLPHKQDPGGPRYAAFPSSSGPTTQPPAANHGVSAEQDHTLLTQHTLEMFSGHKHLVHEEQPLELITFHNDHEGALSKFITFLNSTVYENQKLIHTSTESANIFS